VPRGVPIEYPREHTWSAPTVVRDHPHVLVDDAIIVGATEDVDGAGSVDDGRVESSRGPRRLGRDEPPLRTCGSHGHDDIYIKIYIVIYIYTYVYTNLHLYMYI
jgi:hypothetical protein